MKTIKRTELIVKTHEVLIVRGKRGTEGWCPRCGRQVMMVAFDGELLGDIPVQPTASGSETAKFHLIDVGDGQTFLCLNSILESN